MRTSHLSQLDLIPADAAAGGPAKFARIDPLQDPAWDALVAGTDGTSSFHTSAWAKVLHETYGHEPFYFAAVSENRVEALLALMEVRSRWTGRRGVSLPFTDVCSVLGTPSQAERLCQQAFQCGRERGWSYFEARHGAAPQPGAQPFVSFYAHIVELGGNLDDASRRSSGAVRRGIRKAAESGLRIEFSNGSEAVQQYYKLHCQTRRKHGVPPQPPRFFENISRHLIEPGHGFVAIARLSDRPVAASVFFRHRRQAIYKFGASDYSFQQLRPNNFVMWEAIKRCAELGCEELHLGRTSLGQEGLRRFKLGFGAREERLSYYRYDFRKQMFVTGSDHARSGLTRVFRCFPPPLFRLAGRLLYPHLS